MPRPAILLMVLGAAAFMLFAEGAAWLRFGALLVLWGAALVVYLRSRRTGRAE